MIKKICEHSGISFEGRSTPYCKIYNIIDHGKYVEFHEVYDLRHPDCPLVHVFQDATSITLIKRMTRSERNELEKTQCSQSES